MAFLKAAGEKAFLHSLQEGFRPSTNILNNFSEQELEYLVHRRLIRFYLVPLCYACLKHFSGQQDLRILIRAQGLFI